MMEIKMGRKKGDPLAWIKGFDPEQVEWADRYLFNRGVRLVGGGVTEKQKHDALLKFLDGWAVEEAENDKKLERMRRAWGQKVRRRSKSASSCPINVELSGKAKNHLSTLTKGRGAGTQREVIEQLLAGEVAKLEQVRDELKKTRAREKKTTERARKAVTVIYGELQEKNKRLAMLSTMGSSGVNDLTREQKLAVDREYKCLMNEGRKLLADAKLAGEIPKYVIGLFDEELAATELEKSRSSS